MRASGISLLSALAVPALGVGALLFSLWPQSPLYPDADAAPLIMLQTPSPTLDRGMSVCLRQQALWVAHCRHLQNPAAVSRSVADYNLIARQCTPVVFQKTGLPPRQEP